MLVGKTTEFVCSCFGRLVGLKKTLQLFLTFIGMVEKWLLQVEKQMFKSLKDIIAKTVPDFHKKEIGKWIISWPGQAILCSR